MSTIMYTPTIPGPDPNTKKPAYKPPRLACDTHTHVYGPSSKYPYAADRPYTPPDAPLDMFEALHDVLGIDRAVIVNASVYGTDNRIVTETIAAGQGRYRGVANIDDTITERELAALHEAGIRGCRFHFVRHLGGQLNFDVFHRVVAMIAPLNWHAEVHFDADDLAGVAPMLKKLPVRYAIDHMGRFKVAAGFDQPSLRTLTALMADDEKCWVKMSGFERTVEPGQPLTESIPFARKIVEAAPDRVIWGTDWPHPNVKAMPNDGDLVDLIPLFAPEPELQHKMLVDNPARLFEFDR